MVCQSESNCCLVIFIKCADTEATTEKTVGRLVSPPSIGAPRKIPGLATERSLNANGSCIGCSTTITLPDRIKCTQVSDTTSSFFNSMI